MNLPTTAPTAAFVEWVGETIFAIAMTVACASIRCCLMITTARLESTCQIVRSVRKICSAVETLRMKCKKKLLYRCIRRSFHGVLYLTERLCGLICHHFSNNRPCGHAIHWHCFKELTTYDTRCPVCKKTAETPEHMAPTWQAMAMGIALQPVPPELSRVVTISCNDCEELDENRRWHFLGVRCNHCMSFNTTVERTTLTGREAALYLDEMDQQEGNSSSVRPMDAS